MTALAFKAALIQKMRESARNDHGDNWDTTIRGSEAAAQPPSRRVLVAEIARSLVRRQPIRPLLVDLARQMVPPLRYRAMSRPFKGVAALYDLVADQHSRDLLIELCAFRALGHRKVKLRRNTPDYWSGVRTIEGLKADDRIRIPFRHFNIDHFALARRDFRPLGFDLSAYCTTFGGSIIFLQRQYELHRDDVQCRAEPGDVVIEAGACWGDTSLYFAHQVGEAGRVLAFEFIPSNIAIFKRNMAANPQLGRRVQLIERPLWHRSGKSLYYTDFGPASRVSDVPPRNGQSGTPCATISIDDAAADLARVDFIKMDIEGAELAALRGAATTIRRFRPKLAISLYHSLSDFKTIPRFIASLGVPYRYYIDHHTIFEGETVLFAIPV